LESQICYLGFDPLILVARTIANFWHLSLPLVLIIIHL